MLINSWHVHISVLWGHLSCGHCWGCVQNMCTTWVSACILFMKLIHKVSLCVIVNRKVERSKVRSILITFSTCTAFQIYFIFFSSINTKDVMTKVNFFQCVWFLMVIRMLWSNSIIIIIPKTFALAGCSNSMLKQYRHLIKVPCVLSEKYPMD